MGFVSRLLGNSPALQPSTHDCPPPLGAHRRQWRPSIRLEAAEFEAADCTRDHTAPADRTSRRVHGVSISCEQPIVSSRQLNEIAALFVYSSIPRPSRLPPPICRRSSPFGVDFCHNPPSSPAPAASIGRVVTVPPEATTTNTHASFCSFTLNPVDSFFDLVRFKRCDFFFVAVVGGL